MRVMAFRLARIAGRLDVDNLMHEMSATLFNEWVGFLEMEPDPADRICDYVRQLTYIYSKVNGQKFEPNDLVIRYGESYAERMKRKAKNLINKMAAIAPRVKG